MLIDMCVASITAEPPRNTTSSGLRVFVTGPCLSLSRGPGRLGGAGSNHLEIAPRLPVGDRPLELRHLPGARAHVVIHELGAQDLGSRRALRQQRGRLLERGRQSLGAHAGVAYAGRARVQLMLDAPQ